ncbi:MAG: 2-thiouracil desulfurase family protein, partial [Alphaproteobacteria bacterium]
QYAHKRIADLENMDLSGYILKSKSPSCGMERVRVYTDKGMPTKKGQGLFAKVLADAMPDLPMEEEGRLH